MPSQKKVIGPSKVYVGKKGIIESQEREELHLLAARNIAVEMEPVKAHRTKKEKKEMSHSEKFVTGGNEKADELAKEGAILEEGFMAVARAETMSSSERRCMQPCSTQPAFTAW